MDLAIDANNAQVAQFVRGFDFFLDKVVTLGSGDKQKTTVRLVKCFGNSELYFDAAEGKTRAAALQNLIDHLGVFGVNLFKNTKLFPYIKAAMLADKKPSIMTLSGHARIVDTSITKKDVNWQLEVGFENSDKKAILNNTQALKIAMLHGEETDNWQGKKITLHAEKGVWFGKEQYGLRVGDNVPG